MNDKYSTARTFRLKGTTCVYAAFGIFDNNND